MLDIGSGIGKFCLIAARQHPATMFFGVEQRPELVHHANVAMEFLRLDNLEFIHANMTQINFKAFDHFYFYNSFFENVDFIGRIDDSVETSLALYKYYTQYLSANLDRMPQGTRLVSFQGSGKEVPENFTLVKSTFNGLLNMYVYGGDFFRLWLPSPDSSALHLLSVITLLPFIIHGTVETVHHVFIITNKKLENAEATNY